MNKEQDYGDVELIDLGAVSEETHGFIPGSVEDTPLPRLQLGMIAD